MSLPDTERAVAASSAWVAATFGFGWQALMVAIAVAAVLVAVSRRGGEPLGEAPLVATSRFRWVAVLMCTLLAGGGVFWSAAEPMYHFLTPAPAFEDVLPGSPAATSRREACAPSGALRWGSQLPSSFPWATGGVSALQQAIVVTAVPASFLMASTLVTVWRV